MSKGLKVKKMNKGFTLVELLVAMAVFLIIVGAILGLFISGIRGQRHALASQELLSQTSYALEYMSRSLRMAKKELGEGCLSGHGLNYETTRGGEGLKFINHLEDDDCQEFFLESGQLMQTKGGQNLALTSGKLEITSLQFLVDGDSQGEEQPRVTIVLKIKGAGITSEWQPLLSIQTTISQRNLNIRY